jgi:hypothetical protein
MKVVMKKRSTYKSNANTTDFNGSLIKQVIVSEKARTSSIKKKVQSKQWLGVCEGRFFEWLAGAMGAAQKVVLEQTPCALAGAAVLHNVIMVHLQA